MSCPSSNFQCDQIIVLISIKIQFVLCIFKKLYVYDGYSLQSLDFDPQVFWKASLKENGHIRIVSITSHKGVLLQQMFVHNG